MSKNIKEIGKELLGKSLNSFHRKTGLTQLEKNNEMQDGILDGILSQVDDAYIEKTEQSNVIHLEGSGDGVVVLDSIEGNTKVNLIKKMSSVFSRTDNVNKGNNYLKMNHCLKPNTKYTRFVKVEKMTLNNNNVLLMCDSINDADGTYRQYTYNITKIGWYIDEITIPSNGTTDTYVINPAMSHFYEGSGTSIEISNIMIVEGSKEDNATVIEFFEGLQSSFEDKVNDEGKYEIEILLNNKNLINSNDFILGKYVDREGVLQNCVTGFENYGYIPFIKVKEEFQYTLSPLNTGHYDGNSTFRIGCYNYSKQCISVITVNKNTTHTFTTPKNTKYIQFTCTKEDLKTVSLSYGNKIANIDHKYNKIKLLLNNPLRGYDDIKDRLCVKDGKMMVEKKCKKYIVNGGVTSTGFAKDNTFGFEIKNPLDKMSVPSYVGTKPYILCDKLPVVDRNSWANWDSPCISTSCGDDRNLLSFRLNKINGEYTTTVANQWLQSNPITVIYKLEEPYYEEVLNEYGEPIILEGYENGTLYIDSTVIPTTTVRYTPKMESFKTLKEVNKNNNLITLDINENIIPYMMDVDYMIMEKELCLLNTKNIRKMEELDMTSMQKRTQDMLERLIKGKTLTEQECKTRVTTYLHAGKITDEQAEELMLLIDEVYA